MSDPGTNAKCHDVRCTSAIGGKAEVKRTSPNRREGPTADSVPLCALGRNKRKTSRNSLDHCSTIV
jgi:hypothetical protein